MSGDFTAAELELLASEADEMLLAGLAHRFEAPEERAMDDDGPPFIGHILGATAIRAALAELDPLLRQITRRATFRRRRERAISGDPMAGQLDLGRIALAEPEASSWPIVRTAHSHDTPENAVLAAALSAVNSWGSRSADRFSAWAGAGLFSQCASEAGRLRRHLRAALGELQLEAYGAGQLLPMAWERLSLGKAPQAYRDAIELAETLLGLADPRRRLSRAPKRDWVVKAMVGGLNEAELQNTAFELWVASRFASHCRSIGFELSFPHQARAPLAVGQADARSVEIWWQSPRPIVKWPSGQNHERRLPDGQWAPISLRPDLVFVSREASGAARMLCVECKNKEVEAPLSSDLSQVFGYLSHYEALRRCALAYRSVRAPSEYRRTATGQIATAIEAPLEPDGAVGEALFNELLD
ncbi:MAG TPA: hypothetical protein VGH58_00775 [Solirubrobacterales bacterium]